MEMGGENFQKCAIGTPSTIRCQRVGVNSKSCFFDLVPLPWYVL